MIASMLARLTRPARVTRLLAGQKAQKELAARCTPYVGPMYTRHGRQLDA